MIVDLQEWVADTVAVLHKHYSSLEEEYSISVVSNKGTEKQTLEAEK